MGSLLNLLRWGKNYFSHVREDSWHFKLVEEVWGRRARRGKACTYYWCKLPTSVLGLLAGLVVLAFIFVAGMFCGFIPTPIQKHYAVENGREFDFFYPYKRLPNGKRFFIAPWEVLLAGVVLYLLIGTSTETFVAMIEGVISIVPWVLAGLIIFLVSLLLYKNWNLPAFARARRSAGNTWDNVCPPLQVDEVPQDQD